MKNPHDGDFKDLAEDHPELLLRLLGILQPGTKTQIKDILRELRIEPVLIDHAYLMENEGGKWIVHFEAITSWNRKQIGSMALYQFLLKRQEKIPVISYIVFMAEKYAPKTLPGRLVYEEDDGLRIEAPYKVIRLWEVDPALAFEPGSEPLLAWVPLLKGDNAEFERATVAIGRLSESAAGLACKPDVLVSKLASLASLRYDKNAIKGFLEKLEKRIMLSTEAFKVSWLFQEGKAEGKAEGKLEAIRIALAAKFPGLEIVHELDQIHRPELLDDLLDAIMKAQSPDDVRSAILSANGAKTH